MAKNPSTASADNNTPASDETPKAHKSIPGTEKIPTGADGKIDFDNAPGEAFVGLNILNLEVGEADGPFVLQKIEEKEFGTGKNKKMLPQYQSVKGNTPVIMPISASFLTKADEAKLKDGDTFLVKRDRNFTSREYGTENCKSYLVKVVARA